MKKVTLRQVLELVKMLRPDEQEELQEELELMLLAQNHPPITEEEFERIMVEKGIMSVPPPITDFTPYQNRKPVEVKGKPVSEILIEERR